MNLGIAISRAAFHFADRCAVVCADQARTFAEIEEHSNRLADGLLRLGMRKQDRVALICDNSVEYIEADCAIFKGGFIRVAINPMLSPPEVAYIIKDSGAKTVITDSRLADVVSSSRDQLSEVRNYICTSGPREGMIEYQQLLEKSQAVAPNWPVDENDLAMLFYTGGTTGMPKGAMHTHDSIMSVLMNLQAEFWQLRQSDVFFSGGSLAHANGFRFLVCFLEGAKFICAEHFDPKKVLETIEREQVTLLSTVPTTLIRLCSYPEIKKYNLESLRLVTYGAAPMPTNRLKDALGVFGQRLAQSYGQAEALMAISRLPAEEHVLEGSEKELGRLASAGWPYSTNEVQIVDSRDKEVKRGEVGEIVVRGKIVMKGYWQKPEATAEALKDGWIHTGDLGTMDEEGYLYLIDRKKDMIISGGYNIYAREVEDVLHDHPAVSEAAVIGVPDEEWGEAIKAVVILKFGMQVSETEIIGFCKDRLASFKKPKSVEFVSVLPRTSVGKISKKDLRAPYWAGQERAIH